MLVIDCYHFVIQDVLYIYIFVLFLLVCYESTNQFPVVREVCSISLSSPPPFFGEIFDVVKEVLMQIPFFVVLGYT